MTRVLLIVAVGVLLCGGTVPALAQTVPPPLPAPSGGDLNNPGLLTALLNTDPQNGTVNYTLNFGSASGQPGSSGSGMTSGRGGSGASCRATPISQGVPSGVSIPTVGVIGAQSNPLPGSQFTYNGQPLPMAGVIPSASNAGWSIVVCNGVPTSAVFIGTPPGPGRAPAAPTPAQLQTVALTTSGTIPMPKVTIQHSPNVNGVVHLATWFWVTGYEGSPLTVTRSAFGANVVVTATPTSYTWDFGDGSAAYSTTSLGVAWPQESGDITHTYTELSSTGFPVQVTFDFNVSYSVNGGPAQALPPITRSASLSFKVGEINTVVVSR